MRYATGRSLSQHFLLVNQKINAFRRKPIRLLRILNTLSILLFLTLIYGINNLMKCITESMAKRRALFQVSDNVRISLCR